MIAKALQLLSLLPRAPREFYERVSSGIGSRWESAREARPSYRVTTREEGFSLLERVLDADISQYLSEASLERLVASIEQRATRLVDAPFAAHHNGGLLLGRLLYALVRATRPLNVVETGVCYGITSAHLLAALQRNGEGHLHSIDLPPLGRNGDAYVGSVIPEELRERWTLRRGASRHLLPAVGATLGSIDLFLHDSQHTYEAMRAEFATAWPLLPSRGLLVADDVQGNSAFQELARRADVAEAVVFREPSKSALFGVAVKRP